jgi:hypothetical protein
MPQKRTSQGDFVTRLHQDAITRKEALKKLEEGAREKELSVLKENSLGGKNVSKIVERLTQVRRREPEGKTTFALAGKTQNRDFPSFFGPLWQLSSILKAMSMGLAGLKWKSERKTSEATGGSRAEAARSHWGAMCTHNVNVRVVYRTTLTLTNDLFFCHEGRGTQVKAFVSPESQKILAEKGIKDGSTLAERSRAMLARKSKVGLRLSSKKGLIHLELALTPYYATFRESHRR